MTPRPGQWGAPGAGRGCGSRPRSAHERRGRPRSFLRQSPPGAPRARRRRGARRRAVPGQARSTGT
eukprot:12427521-Alexandrium_andersonii.AAC.1